MSFLSLMLVPLVTKICRPISGGALGTLPWPAHSPPETKCAMRRGYLLGEMELLTHIISAGLFSHPTLIQHVLSVFPSIFLLCRSTRFDIRRRRSEQWRPPRKSTSTDRTIGCQRAPTASRRTRSRSTPTSRLGVLPRRCTLSRTATTKTHTTGRPPAACWTTRPMRTSTSKRSAQHRRPQVPKAPSTRHHSTVPHRRMANLSTSADRTCRIRTWRIERASKTAPPTIIQW